MAKVLAQDYFTNSNLFTATIINGRPVNSATSSGVRYSLKCKKCTATTERTGNSPALNTCKSCGRKWDRETNSIVEKDVPASKAPVVEAPVVPPKPKPTRGGRKIPEPVVDTAEEDPFAVLAQPKVTTDRIVDLLIKSTTGDVEQAPIVKTKALKKKDSDVYAIEEIIDYYDARLEDRWHRIYYVQWVGYDKPTFVSDDNFTDKKFLKEFEDKLPEEERFAIMFPKTKIKNKGTKHAYRTMADVYEDHGISDDVDVVEELPVAATTTTTKQIIIPVKSKGETFFVEELGITLVYQ